MSLLNRSAALLGAAGLAFGIAACEESASTQVAGASGAISEPAEMPAHIPGGGNGTAVYMAELQPLNANAAFGIEAVSGKAIIREHRGELRVTINAQGLTPNTVHLQHIHGGDACPTMAQDVNFDGFISVGEGAATYGPILVTLDNDLANLAMQIEGFPTASNQGGAITYKASESVADLNAAVQGAIGQDLNITTRHIVLHSVAPDAGLPETVGSIGAFPAELTLPVACGTIVQVN